MFETTSPSRIARLCWNRKQDSALESDSAFEIRISFEGKFRVRNKQTWISVRTSFNTLVDSNKLAGETPSFRNRQTWIRIRNWLKHLLKINLKSAVLKSKKDAFRLSLDHRHCYCHWALRMKSFLKEQGTEFNLCLECLEWTKWISRSAIIYDLDVKKALLELAMFWIFAIPSRGETLTVGDGSCRLGKCTHFCRAYAAPTIFKTPFWKKWTRHTLNKDPDPGRLSCQFWICFSSAAAGVLRLLLIWQRLALFVHGFRSINKSFVFDKMHGELDRLILFLKKLKRLILW